MSSCQLAGVVGPVQRLEMGVEHANVHNLRQSLTAQRPRSVDVGALHEYRIRGWWNVDGVDGVDGEGDDVRAWR